MSYIYIDPKYVKEIFWFNIQYADELGENEKRFVQTYFKKTYMINTIFVIGIIIKFIIMYK